MASRKRSYEELKSVSKNPRARATPFKDPLARSRDRPSPLQFRALGDEEDEEGDLEVGEGENNNNNSQEVDDDDDEEAEEEEEEEAPPKKKPKKPVPFAPLHDPKFVPSSSRNELIASAPLTGPFLAGLNLAKFAAAPIPAPAPKAPSSVCSEAPVTDKYRKYRQRQKDKFAELQRDLEVARADVEKRKEKERKLLYLLLISQKQVTTRDEELLKLHAELERRKAAVKDAASSISSPAVPAVNNHGPNIAAASSGGAIKPPAASSSLLTMRMASISEYPGVHGIQAFNQQQHLPLPLPLPQHQHQHQHQHLLHHPPQPQGFRRMHSLEWYNRSGDLCLNSIPEIAPFGEELLERVLPEGKEEEIESTYFGGLLGEDPGLERPRQKSFWFRTQSSLVQQFAHPESSQPSLQPPAPRVMRNRRTSSLSIRGGSMDQLIAAAGEIRQTQNEAEKLRAGYYSQLFKKA